MSRERLHELIDQVPEERLACLEDMVTLILGNDYPTGNDYPMENDYRGDSNSSICPIALGQLYQDQDV